MPGNGYVLFPLSDRISRKEHDVPALLWITGLLKIRIDGGEISLRKGLRHRLFLLVQFQGPWALVLLLEFLGLLEVIEEFPVQRLDPVVGSRVRPLVEPKTAIEADFPRPAPSALPLCHCATTNRLTGSNDSGRAVGGGKSGF